MEELSCEKKVMSLFERNHTERTSVINRLKYMMKVDSDRKMKLDSIITKLSKCHSKITVANTAEGKSRLIVWEKCRLRNLCPSCRNESLNGSLKGLQALVRREFKKTSHQGIYFTFTGANNSNPLYVDHLMKFLKHLQQKRKYGNAKKSCTTKIHQYLQYIDGMTTKYEFTLTNKLSNGKKVNKPVYNHHLHSVLIVKKSVNNQPMDLDGFIQVMTTLYKNWSVKNHPQKEVPSDGFNVQHQLVEMSDLTYDYLSQGEKDLDSSKFEQNKISAIIEFALAVPPRTRLIRHHFFNKNGNNPISREKRNGRSNSGRSPDLIEIKTYHRDDYLEKGIGGFYHQKGDTDMHHNNIFHQSQRLKDLRRIDLTSSDDGCNW